MELWKYTGRRLLQIILIFFVILTVLFMIFRLAPGDPVDRMIDAEDMSQADIDLMIQQLGLDRPVGVQYAYYLKNFISGNFGISFDYGRPVVEIIAERLPNTLLLFVTATILAAFAGVFLGKIASWYKGKRIDASLTIGALATHTIFLPWMALLIIWLFAYQLGWFPITGMFSEEVWLDPDSGFWAKSLDIGYHMALPLGTLFLHHVGMYLLIMRTGMLETLKEDYILTARAKGLPERVIRNRHAAPNAALPVVTTVGLNLAFTINGGALTERVFSWPGIANEFISAVAGNDYPLAQACFLLLTLVVLVSNLVVDILYAYLDPRIRY